MNLNIFNRHLYVTGERMGVDLTTNTKKDKCRKEIGLIFGRILTTLVIIVNITGAMLCAM